MICSRNRSSEEALRGSCRKIAVALLNEEEGRGWACLTAVSQPLSHIRPFSLSLGDADGPKMTDWPLGGTGKERELHRPCRSWSRPGVIVRAGTRGGIRGPTSNSPSLALLWKVVKRFIHCLLTPIKARHWGNLEPQYFVDE